MMSRPVAFLLPALLASLVATDAADAQAGPRVRARKAAASATTPPRIAIPAKFVKKGPARTSPPKDPTPGSLTGTSSPPRPPVGADDVAADLDGDLSFRLTANAPFVPFAGRLTAHYPRDWDTSSFGDGEVWISNQRLPQEAYVQAEIFVQPGYEYRVDLCTTSNSGESIVAEVGGTTHSFDAGINVADCDLTLLLTSGTAGWTNVRLRYAHSDGLAFALNRVKVQRHAL